MSRGDTVKVDTDVLNLRERPGIDQPVFVSLGTGVVGTVVGGPQMASNLNWVELETGYGRGWSVDTFLADSDSPPTRRTPEIGDVVYVDTDGVNLRDLPEVNAEVNVILLSQETATVIDGPREADGHTWFQLESARGTGWAASRYLGIGQPDPINPARIAIGDTVGLTTDGINVRATTSLSARVIRILLAGDIVYVVGGPRQAEGYTWFRLATDYGDGWAVDQYLKRESAAPLATGATARVRDGELNLRSEASEGADIIGVLADSTFVEVIEGRKEADGRRWLRVHSSRFGSGWAAEEFLVRA